MAGAVRQKKGGRRLKQSAPPVPNFGCLAQNLRPRNHPTERMALGGSPPTDAQRATGVPRPRHVSSTSVLHKRAASTTQILLRLAHTQKAQLSLQHFFNALG